MWPEVTAYVVQLGGQLARPGRLAGKFRILRKEQGYYFAKAIMYTYVCASQSREVLVQSA